MDGTVAHPDDSDLDRAEALAEGALTDIATPNLGRMFGARLSTADPQAFPQAETEPAKDIIERNLDVLNHDLHDLRMERASLQKTISNSQEELRRVNKVISALEMAAERLAEGV